MHFFVKIDDRKANFITFDALKTLIFCHISLRLWGRKPPAPTPMGQWRPISTKEENYDDLVFFMSLFSFPFSFFFFLSFPFLPSFFFVAEEGGPGPPPGSAPATHIIWTCAHHARFCFNFMDNGFSFSQGLDLFTKMCNACNNFILEHVKSLSNGVWKADLEMRKARSTL